MDIMTISSSGRQRWSVHVPLLVSNPAVPSHVADVAAAAVPTGLAATPAPLGFLNPSRLESPGGSSMT